MDTSSEEWRHECEARTTLAMPLLKRQAHLTAVETKRKLPERRRLEATMMRFWIDDQVDKLLGMQRDDQRMEHLLKLENATNSRTRDDVERAMNLKLTRGAI